MLLKSNSLSSSGSGSPHALVSPKAKDADKSASINSNCSGSTQTTESTDALETDAEPDQRKKTLLLKSNSRGSNGSTSTWSGGGEVCMAEVPMSESCNEFHCNTTEYHY